MLHGRCYPTLRTGFSEEKQALALIVVYLVHAGLFPQGVLYPAAACSSGGAIMRRLDWRSGCGACGWSRKPSPGASGCCPALLRGPAIVADRPRTNAGGSPRDQEAERSVRVMVGAVPAAKIAAVERREASVSRGRLRRLRKLVYGARRAPRLASVELLMRLSALRSLGFVPGRKRQADPSPDKNTGRRSVGLLRRHRRT